jgi:DHA2 family multidrug resistance protein
MVGIPLILIPVASLSYRGLPADKSSEASAMSTLLRNLGGSIGIAWVANALHQRSHLHYERLNETVTLPDTISIKTMAETAWQQASFIAYLDIYWLLGMMAFLACWLPLLFHKGVKVN